MHTRSEERERLAAIRDEIDRSATRIYPPPRPASLRPEAMVQPPQFGGPQRDAINSLIDKVVGDVCERISELEHKLEELRQQVLVGGAAAKTTLQEQVEVCLRVNDETSRISDIVGEIAQRVMRLS